MNSSARPSAWAASARAGGSSSRSNASVRCSTAAGPSVIPSARPSSSSSAGRHAVGCRLRQRPAQVGDAALRRAAGHRRAPRLAQQRGHPLLAALGSREQVRRDLLGRRAGVAQHARRLLVLQLALAERQLLVHGVAHERVDEAEREVRPQDLGARERARGVGHARLVERR